MNQLMLHVKETKERTKWLLDTMSLVAVLQYAGFRFLQSTMFNFYYSNLYKLITMGILLLFGGVRYLYVVINKLKGYEQKIDKIKYLLRCGAAWLLALPFFYVGWKHDYKFLIFLPICCMCLYDMEAEKVCKWFLIVIGTCLVALILCCLAGTVKNLLSRWWYKGSYGTVNTTDFASYFTFLFLVAWCGMKSKKWCDCFLFVGLVILVSFIVWNYTDSRTFVYSSGIIIFFVLWDALYQNIIRKRTRLARIGRRVNWLSVLAFPLIGVSILYLVTKYAVKEPWTVTIEQYLSGRLETILEPYNKYGISAFGNAIKYMHGVGGTSVSSTAWSNGYGYIDVAYAMMTIKYGWVITIIIGCIWIWMTIRVLRAGKTRFAFSMVVLAFHAISEARILDVNYNIFIVMPFCAFNSLPDSQERKKVNTSIFVGIAIVMGVWLILPRMLSWLRTFFYLKGWNDGVAAFSSFTICTGLVFLLWMLWKSLSAAIRGRKKADILRVIVVFSLLAAGTLLINNTIERGKKEQAERLRIEKPIIKRVQLVSSHPVYAAEAEEMYVREGIDIPGHVFSLEEIGREKGSIFVDQKTENLEILRFGGAYTQISDWSGLYTYDSAVIEALVDCVWKGYNPGKRSINIRDMALFNEQLFSDCLSISNGTRVESFNSQTDQFCGSYEVCFSLSGLKSGTNEEVALLEVVGDAGEKIIYQRLLSIGDFDEDGCCQCMIEYKIEDTPKVTYAITVMDGVTVTIDDITWWRLS